MERIAIITPDGQRIKDYLDSNMENVETTVFNDIFLFYQRVKQSAFRADTILMMDNGLRDTTYGAGTIDNGAALLKEVLADMPLVEIERVVYLNLEKNMKHKELIKFLAESKYIKARIIIATYPQYQVIMIKQLLIQNSQTYGDKDNKYKYVIRKERNARTSSKILNQYETNKAVLLEHRTVNHNIHEAKSQLDYIKGNEEIPEIISDEEVVGSFDIDIEEHEAATPKRSKIIAVIGESKSGCSVTSMILAASSAVFGQTLLVDMNYTNLGLSYLVEKTLIEDEYHNIKLEEVISRSDGVVKLREDVYQKSQLHIISNSLPVKKQMDRNEFGFAISNILRMYKGSYETIILDIPVDEIQTYSQVITMVDRVVLCTPPYMNNIISLLTKISKSQLMKSPAFATIDNNKFRDVILFRTKIFARVNKEIKAIKSTVINRYAKALLKAELKVTGIYVYNPKAYLDTILLRSIMEA